jgi:hypothetical protein
LLLPTVLAVVLRDAEHRVDGLAGASLAVRHQVCVRPQGEAGVRVPQVLGKCLA